MQISTTTFIAIICAAVFITYVVCSFMLDCNIDCNINYNKIENYTKPKKPFLDSDYSVHFKKDFKNKDNPFMRNIKHDITIKNNDDTQNSYIEQLLGLN